MRSIAFWSSLNAVIMLLGAMWGLGDFSLLVSLGLLATVISWASGLICAVRNRSWFWIPFILVLSPVAPLMYAAYLKSPKRYEL